MRDAAAVAEEEAAREEGTEEYVCTDSAAPAPAHAHTHAHRTQACVVPRQSSGVSQTPHPTACPQTGIPHRPP